MLMRQAEEVLCPQGHSALQRHAEGEGEGDGLLCMSLPQSAFPCSSYLISAPGTDFTTYIFCTITLLFALSKHTQAQEHYLALSIHTSTRSPYFFSLSTPAAQEHFPPGHRHCHNHCTQYNRACIWKHSV